MSINIFSYLKYVGCLQLEFNGAGLNLADAVTKVNVSIELSQIACQIFKWNYYNCRYAKVVFLVFKKIFPEAKIKDVKLKFPATPRKT